MPLFASSGQLGGTALTLRAAVDGCPCPYRGGSHARSRLVKLRRARRSHSGGFLTRRFARHILKWSDGGGRLPVLRGPTGNGLYVMLGFVGQFALPRKPVLDSARAGVKRRLQGQDCRIGSQDHAGVAPRQQSPASDRTGSRARPARQSPA